MCIIIVKPAGKPMPTETTMRNCWSTNHDGFGAMWRMPNGHIKIDKGYMTLDRVLEWNRRHARDLVNTDVVMHFRYSTHGGVTAGNTHPFPITENIGELRALDFECDRAIAHNGVLSSFGTSKTLSDTMVFAKYLHREGCSTFISTLISKQVGKFVYMTAHDTFVCGDFVAENGLFFSNGSFRTYTYANRGGYYDGYYGGCGAYNGGHRNRNFRDTRDASTEQKCSGACDTCDDCWAVCPLDHACHVCHLTECAYTTAYNKKRKDVSEQAKKDNKEELKTAEEAAATLSGYC